MAEAIFRHYFFNPKNAMKQVILPNEKQIQRILLLGILWGLGEIFIGRWIKTLTPTFFGMLMPFLVACFILWAKRAVPVTGSVLLMGILAATIKLFASGMVFHGAFTAILTEAFFAELLFFALPAGFWANLSVALSIELYAALHPLITRGSLCLSTHFLRFKSWVLPTQTGSGIVSDQWLLVLFFTMHIVMGIAAALLIEFLPDRQKE